MIRELLKEEYVKVHQFAMNDIARNYFVLLAFENKKPFYHQIVGEWGTDRELKAVLLKRQSGNMQFYAIGDFNIEEFSKWIFDMDFKALISPCSYCDKFLDKGLFTLVKDGAIIAELTSENFYLVEQPKYEIDYLNVSDLDEVVRLYEKVFTSFSTKEVMIERLIGGRGRGLCIRSKGEIISVAQSEFETDEAALIVGVATKPGFQKRGLAMSCVWELSRRLLEENKNVYLQYDNLDAGRIYSKIGFKPVDQVKHYIK